MANVVSDESKILKMGFEAMNKNLTDCAKSLRTITDELKSLGHEKSDDIWYPAIGDDAVFPDRKLYDWVLVKLRDLNGDGSYVYSCPHIAMYHSGKWWSNEWDGHYGTDKIPFEVIAWKPIPGDNFIDIQNVIGKG